jgi:SM-20-related protein
MEDHILTGRDEDLFEGLIQGLLTRSYGLCDDFLDTAHLSGLRLNVTRYKEEGAMHPAGIGRSFDYQRNTTIRGDVIKWIEKDTEDAHERAFLSKIEHFIRYLNQTCYTSINDYEFHYAWYERNSFYKRHVDQFKSSKGRKYSMVLYLNEVWQEKDGGHLVIYLKVNHSESIRPAGGRVVFFQADQTEHEVEPSINRNRISIAGWLKSI